jgi:hypothetical protein
MTIHTKTALILLATLVLGIFLGGLISGSIWRRLAPPGPEMMPEDFVLRFEALIDPTATQADTVRAILENYADRFVGMHDRHQNQMTALMDSMQVDLSTVITDRQLRHMKDVLERRRHWVEGPPFRRRGHRQPERRE